MNRTVDSNRTIYIPSEFAKKSLIYLQEVGKSKTIAKNTNSRNKLDSYLFFVVLEGTGSLTYNNKTHVLSKGSCVFVDCNHKYSHTSDNWTIEWVHFNGLNTKDIYQKYVDRNGLNIFSSNKFNNYLSIINDILSLSNSNNYIKDMLIHEKLTSLLTLIMSETIYEKDASRKHLYDISTIKQYIDDNYLEKINLDDLSKHFFINKFYLTRLFKQTYGITISNYILNKKITKAKELLRYSDLSIDNISRKCGINDSNYFSRLFKQVEGVTAKEYRNKW